MYRRDNRKDFCEFKVLKTLVWLAQEGVSSTNSLVNILLQIKNLQCTVQN